MQLEIFDLAGNLVRRFASDDVLKKPTPTKWNFRRTGSTTRSQFQLKRGMHRLSGTLHYAFPADVKVSFYGPSAPHALPGRYTVKLTVNGKSYEQPLVVKMDPRVKTSPVDLQKMFRAESLLAKNVAELSTALRQAKELQASITARNKEVAGQAQI